MIEAKGLREIAADLSGATRATTAAAYDAMNESATDLQDTWRRNAKQTSGKTAKRYPETITAWPRLGASKIEFEIYPDARVNGQAKLGEILEFGTPKNPPHLDGARAIVEVEPRMQKRVTDAVAGALLSPKGRK